MISWLMGHMKDGGQTGLEIGRMVQIVVYDSFAGAFAKDGAPNEAQRRRAFGGCGRWCLIPNTAEDRTTWVEGIGRGQTRGWSVVCEPHAIQSASGWVSRFLFFLKIPRHQVAPLPWDRLYHTDETNNGQECLVK
jgi:hypothetical protein